MSDDSLVNKVEDEVLYQLELTKWFERRHPEVARRIGLANGQSNDPFVTQLIGANAVCVAAVRREFDGRWSRFEQQVLGLVRPLLAIRVPSFAIAQVRPKNAPGRYDVPAGTSVLPSVPSTETPAIRDGWAGVRFDTTIPQTLWPIATTRAWVSAEKPQGLAEVPRAAAWLNLELEPTSPIDAPLSTLAKGGLVSLRFFLAARGTERGQELYRSLVGDVLGAFARCDDRAEWKEVAVGPAAEPAATDDLLWPPNRSVDDRLLAESALFPQKRLFVEIGNPTKPLVAAEGGTSLRVAVALVRAPEVREVAAADFALGCVPAINLFSCTAVVSTPAKRLGTKLAFQDDFRHPLVIVRVAKVVESVSGTACQPFYGGKFAYDDTPVRFWYLERRGDDPSIEEVIGDGEARPAANDKSVSDVLRVMDASGRPAAVDLQLAVTCLCGHGDRPFDEFKRYSTAWRAAGHEAALLVGPTRAVPLPSRIEARNMLLTAMTVAGLAMQESGDAAVELQQLLAVTRAGTGTVQVLWLTVEPVRRPEVVDGVPTLRYGRRVALELVGPAAYPFAVALDEYLRRTTDAGTFTVTTATIFDCSDGQAERKLGWEYQLPSDGSPPRKVVGEDRK